MIVTLIGFRGTGKSSVAPLLAGRLDMTWVDADRELVQRAGKSIAAIFAESGEAEFRRMEAELLRELLQQDQCVIASGGGAVMNPGTRDLMKSRGPVVWLQADADTILDRLGQDPSTAGNRPALTALPQQAEITALLTVREPVYRALSDWTVNTAEYSPEQIAEQIAAWLESTAEATECRWSLAR